MSNDYLWDGSGEPDPEVQKLESTLGKFRYKRPAPEFPEIAKPAPLVERWSFRALLRPQLKIAAWAAILVIAAAGLILSRLKPARVLHSEWNVTAMQGAPRLAGEAIKAEAGSGNLGVGQVFETDSASKATLRSEQTGEIQVEPGTRLRVMASGSGLKRLSLERGTIQATIWAAPGEFVVDTPSAVAVDLGCVYTLHVDGSGDGLLRTALGWVGFRFKDRESFIPAGAACATRKKNGPGTPYFEDASESFRNALAKLDLPGAAEAERAAALDLVLSQARQRDALTLWHLLARVRESDRGRVYDRLSQFVPAPAGVTREGVLRLDRQMLDLWWSELGLGDVSLWRHWERSWGQQQ